MFLEALNEVKPAGASPPTATSRCTSTPIPRFDLLQLDAYD